VVCVGVPIFSLVDGVEGGNKFFSPILPVFDPADGGDCCSVAPEVSGLPVFAVGGADSDEGSAAKTGLMPAATATRINERRRVMSSSFLCYLEGFNAEGGCSVGPLRQRQSVEAEVEAELA